MMNDLQIKKIKIQGGVGKKGGRVKQDKE